MRCYVVTMHNRYSYRSLRLSSFYTLFIYLFICAVIKMTSHNKTYMQDNKATSAALTGALSYLLLHVFSVTTCVY